MVHKLTNPLEKHMNWDLEGKRVVGNYLGLHPYTGVVTNSRVKYGGKVDNLVELDTPITVWGTPRTCVSAETNELTVVG